MNSIKKLENVPSFKPKRVRDTPKRQEELLGRTGYVFF
jgi:hypothetical protein